MPSFPLLQLPLIPLIDTLKCWNPIELFTLSQCSKKMVRTIKLGGTQKFILSVDFKNTYIKINNNYYFDCHEKSKIPFNDQKKTASRNFGFKKNQVKVPVAFNPGHKNNFVHFLSDDLFTGMRETLFDLSEIFGCRVDELCTGSLSFGNFQSIIEELMRRQIGIRSLSLISHHFKDDGLKWILDNVKVNEMIYISVETSENFKYNFKRFSKGLIIGDSSWITLDYLLSFNSCVLIELTGSNLTNQDLDVFMNSWKSGRYPKLEFLGVQSRKFSGAKPIAGLSVMKNTENPITREKKIMNSTPRIYQGVDIQRDDGVMGTFELDPKDGWLQLLVWN